MSCANCYSTGTVALTNWVGQIYEYRKCPICTCPVCNGEGYVRDFGPDRSINDGRLHKRLQPCWKCRPDRFDAHVRLFRRLMRDHEKFMADVRKTADRAVDPQLDHSTEFYESVYRNCLGPLERMLRAITHNKNGRKR